MRPSNVTAKALGAAFHRFTQLRRGGGLSRKTPGLVRDLKLEGEWQAGEGRFDKELSRLHTINLSSIRVILPPLFVYYVGSARQDGEVDNRCESGDLRRRV
jgi:hypothetical protein